MSQLAPRSSCGRTEFAQGNLWKPSPPNSIPYGRHPRNICSNNRSPRSTTSAELRARPWLGNEASVAEEPAVSPNQRFSSRYERALPDGDGSRRPAEQQSRASTDRDDSHPAPDRLKVPALTGLKCDTCDAVLSHWFRKPRQFRPHNEGAVCVPIVGWPSGRSEESHLTSTDQHDPGRGPSHAHCPASARACHHL